MIIFHKKTFFLIFISCTQKLQILQKWNPSFRLERNEKERNGEILVFRNHSIVYGKKGFLDFISLRSK